MKKLFLSITLVFFAYNSSFAWYYRTCSNGGPGGYGYTEVVRSGENTSIKCSNPGFCTCPVIMNNSGGSGTGIVTENLLINLIVANIQNGQLTGKYMQDGFIAVWESTDVDMTNSTIQITNK